MGRLARVKAQDPFEDWGPIMYRVLEEYGIKPWEFGELTYPWLIMILERRQASPSKPVSKKQIAKSKDLARKMADLIGNRGNDIGSLG